MTAQPIEGARLLCSAACELERVCAAALNLVRPPRKPAPRRKPRNPQ